jgi:hypothetical protein
VGRYLQLSRWGIAFGEVLLRTGQPIRGSLVSAAKTASCKVTEATRRANPAPISVVSGKHGSALIGSERTLSVVAEGTRKLGNLLVLIPTEPGIAIADEGGITRLCLIERHATG